MIIRKGIETDLPRVLELVKELAEFERAPNDVINTLEKMRKEFSHTFHFIVAEENGFIHGMALYYYAYSTWKGKYIYLDDLIVTELSRGRGIGKMLTDELLKLAQEEGIAHLRWHVLDWNTPAIEFYKRLPVTFDPDWITVKLNLEL